MCVDPPDTDDALIGPVVLEPRVIGDERGFFMVAWNRDESQKLPGFKGEFIQDNQSSSRRGVLRGLHYQVAPMAQGKLVRVVRGAVFDVAVDLRRASPTFSQWIGVELTDENKKQMWIPPGYAHGFLALTEPAELVYKITNPYSPDHERSIRWDDPDLDIDWPIDGVPLLSRKDRDAPRLRDASTFA